MKKLILTAITTAMILSLGTAAFAQPQESTSPEKVTTEVKATAAPGATTKPSSKKYSFTDINDVKYEWAASYIQDMSEKGYVTGYEDKTYRPDNDVTRQECLSLFARAMGSGNEENAEILKMAHNMYDDKLKSYGLTWGQDEIVYLMYKGALKETDLVTYLKGDAKSTPMSRHEAAVIITKAMGGEDEANANSTAKLAYSDTASIPTASLGYVKYVTDNGIMNGMENNRFSPNTPVKRSQIAVMLSRVIDKCNYKFMQVKLTAIDDSVNTITVKDENGTVKTYVFRGDTQMKVSGEATKPEYMVEGVSAILTLSGEKLVAIDALSSVPDKTVVGRYQSYQSTNGVIRITLIPTGEADPVTYECAKDVALMFDGSPATVRSYTKGDYISLEMSGGYIDKVDGSTKTETVTGAIVENVSISPKLTMTISHADDRYDGVTLDVDNNVSVRKNGAESSMDEIYSGDKVTLTLEYGVIVKVAATSNKYTKEGTIKSITYSDRPSIQVAMSGEVKEFEVPNSCTIVTGQSNGTLYDFRVGDKVKLTLDSNAVTKIEVVSSAVSTGSITGKVQSVNSSYGFISVLTDDSTVAQTVFCRDNTTKFLNATTGDTLKMSKVNEGDTVQVNGSYSNGAFVAKVVLVTPADTNK